MLIDKGTIVKVLLHGAELAVEHGKDVIADSLLKLIPGFKESATHQEVVELIEAGQTFSEKLKAVLN